MLEETGLAYEPHLVRFATNDQKSPEFQSLSPQENPCHHRPQWPRQ